ncbi:MAG: CapA family protein [Spirochaetales bacterium]|jgi:hypothetical protein|nr:CapA family protein [Spirochaetales bacterium]
MKHDCQILICGDLCVLPETAELFDSGNAAGLFKGLMEPFRQADLLIGNLECPLTDIGQGITKCGPVLKGKTACISALKAAGFDLLSLANNHIRDCGDEGVLSTLDSCHHAGISTVGAGAGTDSARKPVVVERGGWKIGVMAFAEHEFNAAAENRAGAHLFDPYESLDEIRTLRKECDYLILLYHGGIEHYVYPSPLLQKKCRKMVDVGADLVLCQHSHCVGTTESYSGGTILYGQGNTIFGYRENDPEWNEGLLVKITLTERLQRRDTIEYLPIASDRTGVDLMPADLAKICLQAFLRRSQHIVDKSFVECSWQDFCEAKQAHYLPLLLGLGRIVNFANRKVRNLIVNILYSKRQLRTTMNLVRCEAHHEVVETILKRASEAE